MSTTQPATSPDFASTPGAALALPLPPTSVAIVGGCGHIGLPLGICLAEYGHAVTLIDSDADRATAVRASRLPFYERGAEEVLARVLDDGKLHVGEDVADLQGHEIVIITIGTPVDEYLDPEIRAFDQAVQEVLSRMNPPQLLVVRSTVFPGLTERLHRRIEEAELDIDLAYCPERIAQGYAMEELRKLPHLVAGTTPRSARRAAALFACLGAPVIELRPVEAELAKLFANAYRYLNFAISNQFYMIAEKFGADFMRIHSASTTGYPRMAGFALPGFAGGPCLLKDTMQLAAFNHNSFALGQAAMMVNEGLPSFLVERLKATRDLRQLTIGILGMAFKGNSDDGRDSLAYKLRKILDLECRRVLCTDPYISDPEFVSLEAVVAEADVLILGAPHEDYRGLSPSKPIVDVFHFLRANAS